MKGHPKILELCQTLWLSSATSFGGLIVGTALRELDQRVAFEVYVMPSSFTDSSDVKAFILF